MSNKKTPSVQRPNRNFAMSDVRAWWLHVVFGSRRVAAWCRDFYLHKTIWLEVIMLIGVAVVGGWILYHFLYAQPQGTSAGAENKLELDVSSLEALRLWGVVREREHGKELRVPAAIFTP